MTLTQLQEITFKGEASIVSASLSAPNETVMLMSSGDVIRYNITSKKEQHLFSVKSSIGYADGGFDIDSPITLYTLGAIVVVVNDYKRHGFVHYPGKYNALHLWREDYHADISCFPLALFRNKEEVPHLIYGAAWNHIQIMNLETRQILTAAKSLIKENAEEDHIKFYEKHSESNKLKWPSPYDYFFGRLAMSPDQTRFLSAGWNWGSCDTYRIYEVDEFIQNARISDKDIASWEHNNRPVCWIDNETVAVAYSPNEECDDNATKDSPHEIHFYNVGCEASELARKIKITGLDVVNSKIHFSKELNAIVRTSDQTGVAVISLDGEILFHDEKNIYDEYNPDLNLFLRTNDKSVCVYKIESESLKTYK